MDKPILLPPRPPSYSTDAVLLPHMPSSSLSPPEEEQERHAPIHVGEPSSSPPQTHSHVVDYTINNGSSAPLPDYVARRWEHFENPDQAVPFHAISRLPLRLQAAFRFKMLVICALQLLLVVVAVATFRFHPEAKRAADDYFAPPVTARLVLAFTVALTLLGTLYRNRNRFPLNWLLLLLFTAVQSVCFVGLGVVLDTNNGVFHCAFTLAWVVIMIALSSVRRKSESSGSESTNTETLLSSLDAGAIAYVGVALVATVLFLLLSDDVGAASSNFGYSMAFQFALLLWFAYDASSMYEVMSPDEYMHGVIYFYTDLILLTLITAAVVAAIAICSWCDCESSNDSNHHHCHNHSRASTACDVDDCCWGDCCEPTKKPAQPEDGDDGEDAEEQQPLAAIEMDRV